MVKYIRDYYKILGISEFADKKTIKKAYKRAVLKYHPDKNAKTKKHFTLINEAYTVLMDDKKRNNYDKLRNAAKSNKNNKKSKKSINVKDAVNTVSDLEDNYGLISKLLKTGSGAMKGKSLMTGSNLILGGIMAGYGVKKGRDYMAKRGKRNNNQ